jgi:hypothetical protein
MVSFSVRDQIPARMAEDLTAYRRAAHEFY